MWKVRAEIVGDFVVVETFESKEEAEKRAEEFEIMRIWDSVQCWNIQGEV